MNNKITVISPCYNGEKYIRKFLDSLLQQTYKEFEVIIINDGSTDNTESILIEYESLFSKIGINFFHILTENRGQAAAINEGLKYFRGDYLMWPDSDDFFSKDAFEKTISFFKKNQDVKFARGNAYIYKENNLIKPIGQIEKKKNITDIFINLIDESVLTCSGRFIITREAFEKSLPTKKIYESRAGQNWQILLPVAYYYSCAYIDYPIYNYIIRENSHSRYDLNDYNLVLNKFKNHKDIIFNAIGNLPISSKIASLIEKKYIFIELKIAIKYGDYNLFKINLNKLFQIYPYNMKYFLLRVFYIRVFFEATHAIYTFFLKLKRR